MFYVTDKIDGVLDPTVAFETTEEAQKFIDGLEAKDKESGSYTEGFYVIVEADPEDVEDDFFED